MTNISWCGRIDNDIDKSIVSLLESEQIEFDKIEKERIEALALINNSYYSKAVDIFHNPLILEEDYWVSLNPNRKNNFKNTKISGTDQIFICNYGERKDWHGFFNTLFRRGKPDIYNDFTIEYEEIADHKLIPPQRKIIPIYQNNQNYQIIRNFITKKLREGGK